MTKKIAYTMTEARERRENLRERCIGEAISASGTCSCLPPSALERILAAAKAFEVYVTTGKIK